MPLDDPQLDLNTSTMSFGDHLEELRRRLIFAVLLPIPAAVVTWFFAGEILNLIVLPLTRALRAAELNDQLQVLAPPEALLTQLKISIIVALIISAPWMLYQAWLFIKPGLYKQERRFVYFLIPGSAILTVAGISLLYFIMLPLVLVVLVNFGTSLDDSFTFDDLSTERIEVDPDTIPRVPLLAAPPTIVEPYMMWLTPDHDVIIVVPPRGWTEPELDDDGQPIAPELEVRRIPLLKVGTLEQTFQLTTYVNFVLLLALGMVIAFQTPLVILLLGWMDIVRIDTLTQNRKKALLGAGVLGAVLTPQDPWSMLAMMIPLYLLFELGILLLRVFPADRVARGLLTREPKTEPDGDADNDHANDGGHV